MLTVLLIGLSAEAQNFTDEVIDPLTTADRLQYEQQIKEWIRNNPQPASERSTIYIPTVVHVLWHDSAALMQPTDIVSVIAETNLDLQKQNTDFLEVPSAFSGIASATNFQLCLAEYDEDGNATTGIIQKYTPVTAWYYHFWGQDSLKYDSLGGSSAWNTAKYLNIWVAKVYSSNGGYAYFPGPNMGTKDGIVIVSKSNFIRRIVTHEFGHYMNLYHVWGLAAGNTCENADSGDYVFDTPSQGDAIYNCPTFPALDTCSPVTPGVNVHNFMNYTNCVRMFTNGQVARMNAAFQLFRSSLLNSNGCNATTAISDPSNPSSNLKVTGYQTSVQIRGANSTVTLGVYDLTGRMLLSNDYTNGIYKLDLPQGLYLYKAVESATHVTTSGKFVVN